MIVSVVNIPYPRPEVHDPGFFGCVILKQERAETFSKLHPVRGVSYLLFLQTDITSEIVRQLPLPQSEPDILYVATG